MSYTGKMTVFLSILGGHANERFADACQRVFDDFVVVTDSSLRLSIGEVLRCHSLRR